MSFEPANKKKTSSDLYGNDAYLIISNSTFCPSAMKHVFAHMVAFACSSYSFSCTASIQTLINTSGSSEATVKRTIRHLHANGILETYKVDDFNYARIFNPDFIKIISDTIKFAKKRSLLSPVVRDFAQKMFDEFTKSVVDNQNKPGPKKTNGGAQNNKKTPVQGDHQNSFKQKNQNPKEKYPMGNSKFPADFLTMLSKIGIRAYLDAGMKSFRERQTQLRAERQAKNAKPADQTKKRDIMQPSTPDKAIPPGFHGAEPVAHTAPVTMPECKLSLSMADRIALKANNFCAEYLPADLVIRALTAGEVLV